MIGGKVEGSTQYYRKWRACKTKIIRNSGNVKNVKKTKLKSCTTRMLTESGDDSQLDIIRSVATFMKTYFLFHWA